MEAGGRLICRGCLAARAAPSSVYYAPKSRGTALILELLPGFFGFLGIGWLYAGETGVGIGCLVGMFVWNFVATAIDVLTLGIFLCVHVPVNWGALALSAALLHNHTGARPQVFRP